MASSSSSPVYPRLPHIYFCSRKPLSLYFLSVPSSILSFPSNHSQFRNWALKTRSAGGGRDANATTDLLTKPLVKESAKGRCGVFYEDEDDDSGVKGEGEGWVDWEDQILEDTVPLVGFVCMILHSGNRETEDWLLRQNDTFMVETLNSNIYELMLVESPVLLSQRRSANTCVIPGKCVGTVPFLSDIPLCDMRVVID